MEFKEPGPKLGNRSRNYDYDAIANALKNHPEQWALVFKDESASYSNRIQKGIIKAFRPAGDFEVTVRGTDNHQRSKEIYVRYIGPIQIGDN